MSTLSHLIGSTSQDFKVLTSVTKDGVYKYKEFRVESRSVQHPNWGVYKVGKGATKSLLFFLQIDPATGVRVGFPKAVKETIDYQFLLNQLAAVSCDELPDEDQPDRTGSILLAVALEAAGYTSVDQGEECININGLADRTALTEDDWINAYWTVEDRCMLPEYLQQQFVDIMHDEGLILSVSQLKRATAFAQTIELPTKQQTEETEQVSVSVAA